MCYDILGYFRIVEDLNGLPGGILRQRRASGPSSPPPRSTCCTATTPRWRRTSPPTGGLSPSRLESYLLNQPQAFRFVSFRFVSFRFVSVRFETENTATNTSYTSYKTKNEEQKNDQTNKKTRERNDDCNCRGNDSNPAPAATEQTAKYEQFNNPSTCT